MQVARHETNVTEDVLMSLARMPMQLSTCRNTLARHADGSCPQHIQ